MLQYDWENSIGCWVVTTAHVIRRALNAELAQQGITMRQWEVLACLSFTDEMTQTELAERLGIEAPTLVGILDRMERDGWLARTPCPDDRRRKRISATDKAETLWARMVDCAHAVRGRAIANLSADDLAQFKQMCQAICQNLAPSDPAFGLDYNPLTQGSQRPGSATRQSPCPPEPAVETPPVEGETDAVLPAGTWEGAPPRFAAEAASAPAGLPAVLFRHDDGITPRDV